MTQPGSGSSEQGSVYAEWHAAATYAAEQPATSALKAPMVTVAVGETPEAGPQVQVSWVFPEQPGVRIRVTAREDSAEPLVQEVVAITGGKGERVRVITESVMAKSLARYAGLLLIGR